MSVIEIINSYDNIYIAGHINPDGDAIGACFATADIVKRLGKKPTILLEPYPAKYDILQGKEYVYNGNLNMLQPGLFIALDTSDISRLGRSSSLFERSLYTINIDHHITNPQYAKLNYILPDASSTCEVVYTVFAPSIGITKTTAEALYTGILMDTGSFRHSSTNPQTHEITAVLMKTGIDFSMLQRELLYTHSVEEATIFGIAMKNLKIDKDISVAYSYVTKDEMLSCGAKLSDLDGIVEYLLNIRDINISILFSERENNTVKASMRSANFDVSAFAMNHGGGGHTHASGASFKGNIDEAISLMLDALSNEIKKQN